MVALLQSIGRLCLKMTSRAFCHLQHALSVSTEEYSHALAEGFGRMNL